MALGGGKEEEGRGGHSTWRALGWGEGARRMCIYSRCTNGYDTRMSGDEKGGGGGDSSTMKQNDGHEPKTTLPS